MNLQHFGLNIRNLELFINIYKNWPKDAHVGGIRWKVLQNVTLEMKKPTKLSKFHMWIFWEIRSGYMWVGKFGWFKWVSKRFKLHCCDNCDIVFVKVVLLIECCGKLWALIWGVPEYTNNFTRFWMKLSQFHYIRNQVNSLCS
jgi:hypothetical protein